MTIYAIGDLHLSDGDKPMDVFGPHWANHFDRIREDWRARVTDGDIVLIPGDISWAMRMEEAIENLRSIAELPGRIIMIRGNHDYWWSAISRVRAALPEGFFAIQNDCVMLDGILFAGSRGWLLPGEAHDVDDVRIYERELLRLEMSLSAARRKHETAPLIGMLHYPPRTEKQIDTGFTELFERYSCAHVVYGHLHGPALKNVYSGVHKGIHYHQVSCDGLNFSLHCVMDAD